MGNFFSHLLNKDFIPHGHCYLWRPEIIWLHVSSDGLIALSYFLIPAALLYLVKRRRDLVFHWMFWMFAAFILLCGTTHVMNIVTLWDPYYRLEGVIKLITGLVSIVTAFCLFPLVPRVLQMPQPEELAAANRALAAQIAVTKRAEEELRKLNAELELRVLERTGALQRSNEDLAQFAYVASHDLQEPLRMVSTYTALLQKRYGTKLDEQAHTFMNYAANGASRMHQLITDLLSYAQIDARDQRYIRSVDSRKAVDMALFSVRLSLEQAQAEVEIGDLPAVQADETQLTQIFQNMIANSLKYRSEAPPRIKIWAERIVDKDECRFFVQDNGTGFDMRFKDRLFNMFQRLENTQPGTGIGLAICKKIIHRHGGTIDVVSSPGAGATFSFTIPATVPAATLI